VGHFAVFDQWTEIDSAFEGRFLERIAPGAFRASLARDRIKILFNHGHDPQLGDKPIASIEVLREDGTGAYYEAPLLDGVPELVIDDLAKGEYGASFRFSVGADDWQRRPTRSTHNPEALRERTITQARVMEFGPVTFPASAGASAGLRSATASDLRELIGELDAFLA